VRANFWFLSTVILIAAGLAGCRGSSREITLGKWVLETKTPIQLERMSVPFAVSSDGSRLALQTDSPVQEGATITVVETDSLKVLGTLNVAKLGQGTPIFSRDGTTLCLTTEEGYIGWSFATDERVKLPSSPRANSIDGWNYDRSLALARPSGPILRPKEQPSAGQVVLPMGQVVPIPPGLKAGFDEFGDAWFGKPGNWTRVTRAGIESRGHMKAPPLAGDQTRDRGSLHLVATETTMKLRDELAYVTCVWLTHDHPEGRPNPPGSNPERASKAAVVFAGADVLFYGFLPGRKLVFVVSSFGCYLVPFEIEKA
jgi:hypothetical protein